MLPNCCLHPQVLEICSKIYQNSLKQELFSLRGEGVAFLLFIISVEEYHRQLMQMSHQSLISHCF